MGTLVPFTTEHPAEPTAREREILDLIWAGLTTQEIAPRPGITTKTVESHRSNLMRKFHVSNMAQLLRVALLTLKRNPAGEPIPEGKQAAAEIRLTEVIHGRRYTDRHFPPGRRLTLLHSAPVDLHRGSDHHTGRSSFPLLTNLCVPSCT